MYYGVAWSVTIIYPAKTAEPMEMSFWLRTRWAKGTMVQMPHSKRQF